MARPYRSRWSPTSTAPPCDDVVVMTNEDVALSLLVHLGTGCGPALVLGCGGGLPQVVIVGRRVGP
jgi:hypothetical protein